MEAFADGHLDRDQLRGRMASLDTERTKLDALAAGPAKVSPKARRAVLSTVTEILWSWARTPGDERRVVVRELAKTVGLQKDAAPAFSWRTTAELAEGAGQ